LRISPFSGDYRPTRVPLFTLGSGRPSLPFPHPPSIGFGHGPRVCPGKHLRQIEVGLVVGAFVKMFKVTAKSPENHAKAGVSTKPLDGTLVDLELR